MNDAEKHMVGGTHYTQMGMQPSYFAMVNGYDADAFSILKYVSRHRAKNGLQDLSKARHFIDLRLAHIEHVLRNRRLITMGEFIRANGLGEPDAWALLQLEAWIDGRASQGPLIQAIEYMMTDEYRGHQIELSI